MSRGTGSKPTKGRTTGALVLSGLLVGVMGVLGLVSTHSAGALAIDQHREDRVDQTRVLGQLTAQTVRNAFHQLAAVLALQDEDGVPPFSAEPGNGPAADRDTARVRRIVEMSAGAMELGAAVFNTRGQVVASYSPTGASASPTDPGFRPLVTAATDPGAGRIPISGIVTIDDEPALALGAPATLSDGTSGLFVCFWSARSTTTEFFTAGEGEGWIVDAEGLVVGAPDPALIGTSLPYPAALQAARSGGDHGIVDTDDGGTDHVSAWQDIDGTTWTVLNVQTRDAFQGHLERASLRTELLVLGMLLTTGTALVVLSRRRERAMAVIASTDELTRIHNRRGWFELAEQELARAARAGETRLAVFLDLDGLKQVNDVLGHEEGDRAIASAAAVLRAACRSGDVLGRLGGDEFVVLLGDGADAAVARRRVHEALDDFNAGSSAAFELRFSIGAEPWDPERPCSVEDLVRRADERMYADKQSRTDRYDNLIRVPAKVPVG
ncbi:sensor domain-containing diguanylate cyclase [Blastococcus saxobsidens]|uniref:Putative Diguanylate kinase n=1 Tax=Blastococcus saxobsidens (strain DD2) TaxID=1146883 RepID=H6RKS4_BLASD|nr:sensor domain-containing diguanylate cyclase [Blastococcus saxobsidens]CCG03690.1 putative Diguanylate kinase [Blastococcus saxobsidens DD2]